MTIRPDRSDFQVPCGLNAAFVLSSRNEIAVGPADAFICFQKVDSDSGWLSRQIDQDQ
jgi:hypothetical protein